MQLKEELEDPRIMDKIRRVLMPQEFTKVDGIIDLVFSTAEDVKKVAHPVLRHRILTNFSAEAEGVTSDKIIDRLLEEIEVNQSPVLSDTRIPRVLG